MHDCRVFTNFSYTSVTKSARLAITAASVWRQIQTFAFSRIFLHFTYTERRTKVTDCRMTIAFSRVFQTTMCTKWVWPKSLQENSGKSPDNLRLNFGLICSRCGAHNLFEKSRIPEFFLNCSRYFVHQKVTLIVAKTVKFSQIFLIPRITTCTWHAQDTDSTVAVAFSRIFLDLPRCAQVTECKQCAFRALGAQASVRTEAQWSEIGNSVPKL